MVHTKETRERAYNKIKARKAAWLKANGPCLGCGTTDNLGIHHRNPSDKKNHRVWTWKAERREKELEKCVVLCSQCHKNYHRWTTIAKHQHGTRNMYHEGKCKCTKCRKARSAHMRKWRATTKLKGIT